MEIELRLEYQQELDNLKERMLKAQEWAKKFPSFEQYAKFS